ncbi:aminoglycoside phosphotransferase family protein [Myceligenerans xiligouense]|uniref:Aminoglycoside phosphotransferase (APT) family kinase protein n=1 Tax=Myceligenerans xiligouense TaxID=253184 RepID=A0A3N4YNU3_9MICO|nr:aminoglycoside phosphotransferase family protein [Myceligenerans xiligouense]RPF21034.1 aminoglycoside phosphotransferase (APT) family kinase protein [Myceligenerans xiligouense]
MVAADIDISTGLARDLLAEQHPDLATLPLEVVANGWDNVMLRLGPLPDGRNLALRLPRREAAAHLIEHEQAALPRLAPRLETTGIAFPLPVRHGHPSERLGFPWSWNIIRWVDGVTASRTDVAGRAAWAGELANFLVTLHVPADTAPPNPLRGVPLAARPDAADPAVFAARLARVPEALRGAATRLWQEAIAAPAHGGPDVWLHGDPHPGNLVVRESARGQELAAVVDFGDVTSGDPASDLATAWLTFDAEGHARFRAAVDAGARDGRGWDEATWTRSRAWALMYATNMLAHPDEHPWLVPIGEHGLRRLLADDE